MAILSPITTRSQTSAVWANPLSAELDPYELGMADALNDEYCLPENYFLDSNRINLYVQGYESVRTSLLSIQARQKWGAA